MGGHGGVSVTHEESLYFAVVAALAREVEPQALSDALNHWVREENLDIAAYLEERGALPRSARIRLVAQATELAARPGLDSAGLEAPEAAPLPMSFPAKMGKGNCTATVMGAAVFESEPEVYPGEAVKEMAGRYSEIREYAKGGMGRIMLVRDEYLDREIALKELLPIKGSELTPSGLGMQRSVNTVARFLQEARVTARLEHPGIVPVYELGYRACGTLYYTMKMVRGFPLDQAIREAGTLEKRLALLPHFIDLCQAIAYAHNRGVIHRDIKPHNVIAGSFGETVVIDWGLAKDRRGPDFNTPRPGLNRGVDRDATEDAGSGTREGDIFGTPAYMPPEQARGELDAVDERSDVYALGAVLYELLTGRHPFQDMVGESAIKLVVTTAPSSVRVLEPKAPPELAAICERAMQRVPEARYASAYALAEEVERYQSGAQVEAYRYGIQEHAGRFMRRHLRLLVVVTVSLLVLLAVSFSDYLRVREREREAQSARQAAEVSEARTAEALRETQSARQASEYAEAAARAAEVEAEASLYRAYISLAGNHIRDGRFDQAFQTIATAPAEYRSWEWGRLLYLCNRDFRTYAIPAAGVHIEADHAPAFSLNEISGVLAIHNGDGTLVFFDPLAGLPVASFFSRSGAHFLQPVADPSGRFLGILDNGALIICENGPGEILHEFNAYYHWVWSASFSGNGERVAVRQSPDSLTLFDPATGEEIQSIALTGLTAAALSHDGTLLATFADSASESRTERGGALAVWELETGTQRFSVPEAPATFFGIGGERLYAAGVEGILRVWDTATGAPSSSLPAHDGAITALTLSADERRIATGSENGEIAVWSLADGALLCRRRAFDVPVTALAFDSKGTLLAAGLDSGPVAQLNAADLHLEVLREGHSNPVHAIQFYESEGLLLSATQSDVKLWRIHDATRPVLPMAGVRAALLDHDGLMTLVSAQGEVARYDEAGVLTENVGRIPNLGQANVTVAPGRRQVLTSGPQGVTLWCFTGQRAIDTWTADQGYAHAPIAFSLDGRYLAMLKKVSSESAALVVAGGEDGVVLTEFDPLAGGSDNAYYQAAVAFTPGGQLGLACGQVLILFDPETGRRTGSHALPQLARAVANILVFSEDGTQFAVTGENHVVHVFGAGGESVQLPGHTAPVRAMAFDNTGKRLFTGSDDSTVKVWDTHAGGELLNWSGHGGPVRVIAYDTNSDSLIAGGEDGLRIAYAFPWEDPAYPGTPELRLRDRVEAYKTTDPRLAPEWGRGQARLAQAAHELLEAGREMQAKPGDPVPEDLGATWAEEGVLVAAFGEPPGFADGKPLRNWSRFLELASLLSPLAQAGDSVGYALVSNEFRAMAPACPAASNRLMSDWYRQGTLLHGVVELGRPFNEVDEFGTRFATLMGDAALKAGDYDLALEALEKVLGLEPWVGSTSYLRALLLRNEPGDLAQAIEIGRPWLESLPHDNEEDMLALFQARLADAPPETQQWLRPLLDREALAWDALPWFFDLPSALDEADRSGRPVYLEIGSESAPGTAHLRRAIYGNPVVQASIRDALVLCYLEADVHPEIVKRYRVRELPALFILDEEGDVVTEDIARDLAYKFKRTVIRDDLVGRPSAWRVLGALLPEEGEDIIAQLSANESLDFEAIYPGIGGPTRWLNFNLSPYADALLMEPWIERGRETRFVLYTRFTGPPGPAFLRILHTGAARVWLNGVAILEEGERTGHDQLHGATCTLGDGPQVLAIVLDDVGPHVNASVVFYDSADHEPLDITSLPMPEGPVLKRAHLIEWAQETDQNVVPMVDSEVTRVEVSKKDVLSEWRENHLRYLALSNPRPLMKEGKITGIVIDNLGQVPLAAKLGLRDGDILTQVNDWRPDSGVPVHEVGKRMEGLNEYTLEILRDGKPHTIIVTVDYN
jgi:serine/threonine protein kinase/WD40 repeat protein